MSVHAMTPVGSDASSSSADPFDMLDVKDVMKLLKVSERWLYEEVRNGRFPCIRYARRYRFSKASIAKYLMERTHTPKRKE